MRIIGLDYGDSKIGVAISDDMQIIATPSHIIESKRSKKKAANDVIELCIKYQTNVIVIGYPLNMDGSKGFRAEATDEFIALLEKKKQDILVVKWDERLTTKSANNTLKEMGVKGAEKGADDMIAASLILQGYLEYLRSKENG